MTPLRKTVLLGCAPPRAFGLFTERATVWWPPERRHLGDPESEILLLPSGRFFERARDGRELELGRVRVFEPPRRLLLDFFVGTDAEHPTEVEVSFDAEGQATRVTVEHRATAATRALFPLGAPAYERSWELLLAGLARAAHNELANGN